MAKIDLEKVLIALLDSPFNKQFDDKVKDALKEQGLEYKDGEIVEVQKSKFKVGDWVVDNHGKVNQVTSVTDDSYAFTLYDGTYVSGCWKDSYHLWTIKDAKDGDVLVSKYEQPFIYNGNYDEYNVGGYCGIVCDGSMFIETDTICQWADNKKIKPATNAQRDLLFQKMKDTGYEWDNEKKELKKIEAEKTSFANRQLYNRAILAILSNYVEKYPDIRFGQMLYNLGISSGAENNFYVESSKTYQDINTILKEQDGKNRVI